jgi:dihydrofolate reductase
MAPGRVEPVLIDQQESQMGKIAVHEFIALDGVFEDPSWTFEFGFDESMGEDIGALTGASQAILLGRRTFEMFAPAWSGRTAEDDPGAPFFNDTDKFVVSSTLTADTVAKTWANSHSLGGYDAGRVRELKEGIDGTIYVSGSGTLVRALAADGLLDSLHLFLYPVIRGTGLKLLHDGMPSTTLRLEDSRTYENGVVYLHYQVG